MSLRSAGDGRAPDRIRVAAVLLAAGQSRRLGGIDKRLLRLDGVPLVRRWFDVFQAAGIRDVVVVLGHDPEPVRRALHDVDARIVVNPDHRHGQQTSVLAGLAALPEGVDAVLVVLVDLVLVRAPELLALIQGWAHRPAGVAALIPFHADRRGNPVIIDARVTAEVLEAHVGSSAPGDEPGGLRAWLKAHPDRVGRFESPHDHFTVDIDTPEDLERIGHRLGRPLDLPKREEPDP